MQKQDVQSHFTYRPNPVLARSFLICKKDHHGNLAPVGDYTVLDDSEELTLSEKKVMNLVMRLNGEAELIPLGNQTQSRLFFHVKKKAENETKSEIVFYTNHGSGVSKENAILTLEDYDA